MKTHEVRAELLKIAQVKPENMQERVKALASKLSTRTPQQNKALHKLFQLLSDELNNAGYSVQEILSKRIDIDWSAYWVKELLWRRSQELVLQKTSTTELKKQEDIDKVYDHLVRHLGEKFGIEVPEFPHYETDPDTAPLIGDK